MLKQPNLCPQPYNVTERHVDFIAKASDLPTVPGGDILVNSFEFRVVESAVGGVYSGNPQKAIEIIKGVLDSFDEVSKEHKPLLGIAFGDSAIELGLPLKRYKKRKSQYEVNLVTLYVFT